MESGRDEIYMQAALEEAGRAQMEGEVPVGAVLVFGGEIIARGYNRSIGLSDPSAHAEIVTLRSAGQQLGNYRLTDTELYVTIEPCLMCMGALIQARIRKLVFGARDPRAGAAGSVCDFTDDRRLNHRMEVSSGILEADCRKLLQGFFKSKR